MVTIERMRRPFWMHQIVEYILGFGLIMVAIQQPEPKIPALMGLLILLNAAVVAGPAGAFKLVPRWLHKYLDLGVIALLLLMVVQPWWELDSTGRTIMFGIAVVMFFIWFHSDFSAPVDRKVAKAKKAAARAERQPLNSTTVGKTAGRYVGHGVNSLKRWKDSISSEEPPGGGA
jgi:hypothetical protein